MTMLALATTSFLFLSGVRMKLQNVLLALVAATPMFAHATDNGFFVDGGLGTGAAEGHWSASTVANLDVGYRWSWFAVDVGYVNLSQSHVTAVFPSQPPSVDIVGISQHGVTADLSGRWNIGPNWYYTIRGGAFFWHETGADTVIGSTRVDYKFHNSGTSWNAGIGTGYDFTKNFSIGLNYDWYDADDRTSKIPSVSAEFRF